jgi:hypothetical protein
VSLTDLTWEPTDYSVLYNNVFTIILTTVLLGMPLFIVGFYMCHTKDLEDKEFRERYGDIYDGLVLSKKPNKRFTALFYPFWFVMRRLIFSLIMILLDTYFWYQILIVMVCSIINICYLCKFKPFEDRKILKLEIMNEVTNIILLYHLMMFTDWVPEAETRYAIGWSFIFVISANILVHFSLLVYDTAKKVRYKIQEYRKMKCCLKLPFKWLPIIEPKG